MSPLARWFLAALIVVGGAVGAYYVATGETDNAAGDQPVEEGVPEIPLNDRSMELVSSEQCARCHQDVYDEWKTSHHAFAWLNPEPRRPELSDNFRNKDCIPCHAPRPMVEVGFGKRPLERESRREDGVNCFTCHKYKNVMLAANSLGGGAAGAPCNPVTWAPVASLTLCAPCHDQHKVQQDWMRSRFAVKGDGYQDCNDCHMPVKEGPGTTGGARKTHRSHLFPGAHDAAMLRTAATLRATRVEGGASLGEAVAALTKRSWSPPEAHDASDARRILIEVKNTGVGHNFPADERHRAVDLIAQWEENGVTVGPEVRLTRFRNPYRHEFEITNPFKERAGEVLDDVRSWGNVSVPLSQTRLLPEYNPDREIFYVESTQLHAGESRVLWLTPSPNTKGVLRLRLYYKLNPYLANADAVLVAETTVEL